MDYVKEVKMLETMSKHDVILDQCVFKFINILSSGGDDTNFVIDLIYRIWNKPLQFIKTMNKLLGLKFRTSMKIIQKISEQIHIILQK